MLQWPQTKVVSVKDINGPDAVEAIRRAEPDIIVVSGTRLIRKPIFDLKPSCGIFNVHTGLSPYCRGGDCTLWCLATAQPWHIGATVHVLDKGIDSGDLLVTSQTRVDEGDSIPILTRKTMETAIELYVSTLTKVSEAAPFRPIPQRNIGTGRLFLARDWNVFHMHRAVSYVQSGALSRWVSAGRPGTETVRLVDVFQ